MKKILIVFTLLLFSFAPLFSANRYVSATGNDSNDGSISAPWATLAKVETSAINGDVVYVGAGTFNATSIHYMKNISLIGVDTTQTIINITSTGAYGLYFWTDDFNANAIEISNIKFTGGLVANRALYIWKKNNVYIHHCSFSGFIEAGISFANNTTPSVWATGLRFEYNSVYNCAPFNSMNSSSIMLIGQKSYTIQFCNISNGKRGAAMPGALIKLNYTQAGLITRNTLKVFNNDDGAGWAFAIESWNANGGDVISYNTVEGVIDLTGGTFSPGTYTLQTYIHHNTIGFSSLQSIYRHAIYIEGTSKYVLIEDNTIKNVFIGVIIYTNSSHASTDITIRKNLITVGSTYGSNYCYGIRQGGTSGFSMTNYSIYNNTIIALSGSTSEVTSGIQLPTGGTVINYAMRNNVIANFFHAPIRTTSGTGTIDGVTLTNNLFYNNGDGNTFYTTGGITPTNVTNTGNITSNPLLDANYVPYAGSPAINAGVTISGMAYYGSAPDIGFYETNYTAGTTTISNHKKISRHGKTITRRGKTLKN